MRKPAFAYAKTKTQISFAVTAKLISAFVFATRIVQSLYFLNTKFQDSSHLLWPYSPVCVGNPEDRFSHNEAQFFLLILLLILASTRPFDHFMHMAFLCVIFGSCSFRLQLFSKAYILPLPIVAPLFIEFMTPSGAICSRNQRTVITWCLSYLCINLLPVDK